MTRDTHPLPDPEGHREGRATRMRATGLHLLTADPDRATVGARWTDLCGESMLTVTVAPMVPLP